jgi:hypothetical protein
MLSPFSTGSGIWELLELSSGCLESTAISRRRYPPLPPEYFGSGAGGTGTGRVRRHRARPHRARPYPRSILDAEQVEQAPGASGRASSHRSKGE